MSITMSATQWFYKPTNSPRYPGGGGGGGAGSGVPGRDAFLTELAARSTLRAVGSATRPLGRARTANNLVVSRSAGSFTLPQSPEEYKQRLTHLGRPTVSSSFRFEHPRLSQHYRDRTVSREGRYVWQKMDYHNDVHRCMWSRYGDVNHSYKLRGMPVSQY